MWSYLLFLSNGLYNREKFSDLDFTSCIVFSNHLPNKGNISSRHEGEFEHVLWEHYSSTTLERSSHERCSVRKGVLRNLAKFTGKHLCQSLFFNKVAGLTRKETEETLGQVFSCEFCEISKNTFNFRIPLGDCFCFDA